MPDKEYYHRPAKLTLARKLKLANTVTYFSGKVMLRNLVSGPPLPSWPLSAQIMVEVIRNALSNDTAKLTDEDLKTIDIAAHIARFRNSQIAVDWDVSETCLKEQFEFPIRGGLLDCPDPLLSELYKNDVAACESGSPRDIIGEVLVPHDTAKTISGKRSFALEPAFEGESVLIHFHGGAFITGSPLTVRRLAANLSAKTGLRVIVPDFRLAPEHPFPAQLHDAFLVWSKLIDGVFKPENIIISGDSAGGCICLSLLLFLKQINQPMPGGAVLLSPSNNFLSTNESYTKNAAYDYLWQSSMSSPLHTPRLFVAPGEPLSEEITEKLRNPLVSPAFGNFAGCPPMLVQAGEKEMLFDDIKELADMVKVQQAEHEKSAKHKLLIWEPYPDMPHVFQLLPFAQQKEATESIGKFVKSLLSKEGAV